MTKRFIYSILILLLAISCENKKNAHSRHNKQHMEGMEMSTMNNHETTEIESYLYEVINPVNEVVISNQETVKPGKSEPGNTISAEGYITFDERRNNKVSARFGGRIEKLYVKYNYQYVKKGQKIMELYSPEINTIEEEYIHHLTTLSDKNLIRKTKEKLLLLGLTENEIKEIEKTQKPQTAISIYCSFEGYVLFDGSENKTELNKKQLKNGMDMGMAAVQNKSSVQSMPLQISEGTYVNEGQILFTVNDFKEVWAVISFDAKVESQIKVNSSVNVINELTDEPVYGILNFIEPNYKEEQKFTQARIYLKNDKQIFKINSLISAEISISGKVLNVPNSAILDLGKRKIVWIKTGLTKEGNKLFQTRNILTGIDRNGFTEIISGISEQDEIAKDAGYLIDSESLIK